MDPNTDEDLTSAFETLQTNSKDELITQMLVLTNLDRNSACFYLESANWKVQNAIDLFYKSDCQMINNYDFECQSRDDSDVNFVKLPTETNFEKIFKVTNCGSAEFPIDAKLRLFSGADIIEDRSQISVPILVPKDFSLFYSWPSFEAMSENTQVPQISQNNSVNNNNNSSQSSTINNENNIQNSNVKPNTQTHRSLRSSETFSIKVPMKSPKNPGFYETQWKVYSKGYYFGQIFKVFLQVYTKEEDNNSITLGYLNESEQRVWYNNSYEFDLKRAQEMSLSQQTEFSEPTCPSNSVATSGEDDSME